MQAAGNEQVSFQERGSKVLPSRDPRDVNPPGIPLLDLIVRAVKELSSDAFIVAER